ncbi:MAG TPA: DUF2278 family protein [Acetobacteraceae bacterium]|nr:DUF2278 family protein [Acetobacteraceae bacterium]
MPISYGILRGTVTKLLHHQASDPSPHVELRVQTQHGPWRLAVNVRSDDKTNLLFDIETDFRHPILDAIGSLPSGLTEPARTDHTRRLDYVRSGLFDSSAMRTVAAKAVGDPNELDDRISAVMQRAMQTQGAEVFAFGNPWGPEHKPDEYFHFSPGRGMHDLHMNQGSPPPHAQDDGVWQDGGLFVRFPGAATVAFFFAFQSQSWQTDDVTGRPRQAA